MSRYDTDPLGGTAAERRERDRVQVPRVPVRLGEVVEDPGTGYVGEIVGWSDGLVVLEDRRGRRRAFRPGPGFWIDGRPVELVAPARPVAAAARTASGSVAIGPRRARVARASRILVEGKHDAELVEKVWGDDLRVEGVVVEPLGGIDDLPGLVAEYRPATDCRIGVLVDHLVPGSKERRLADAVARGPFGRQVLVVGHPFVDIWAAVDPGRLKLRRWPDVPREVPWKEGICAALGWPRDEPADLAAAWTRILRSVRDIRDLSPTLSGRVEELIDFVTAAPGDG